MKRTLIVFARTPRRGAVKRRLAVSIGAAAALTLFALFPQSRFGFMALLSVYIAVCAYLLTGERNQYMWTVAGFVCLIICLAGPVPQTAFNQATARVVETAMGIAVYTLVAVFLWPQRSAAALGAAAHGLLEAQARTYRAYRELARGGSEDAGQGLETSTLQAIAL